MIAIIAKNGMLGQDVVKYCELNNIEQVAFDRTELDITKLNDLNKLDDYDIDVIINCSAYTNVDLAESEIKQASAVNYCGVDNLAQYASKRNIKLVHVSTDYVFDGNSNVPYNTTDECTPQTVYGLTKYQGEQAIINTLEDYLIIRTSWLFGKNGKNFVSTMMSLADKEKIKVVTDQVGRPTYTVDLVAALFTLMQTDKKGIYHIANDGECSWNQFAQEIMRQINSNCLVEECTSEQFKTLAKRPSYSVMNIDNINKLHKMPSWSNALERYLMEVK